MQADAVARDVGERGVDGRNDAIDEAEEIAQRPVLVGHVPLHREIGAVELQQEAVVDDGFVFDAQRLAEGREVGFLARVVVVAQRRGDDAG